MKYFIESLGANLVALASVIFAGYLALNEKQGWGWFLIIGVICFTSVSMTTVDNKKDK